MRGSGILPLRYKVLPTSPKLRHCAGRVSDAATGRPPLWSWYRGVSDDARVRGHRAGVRRRGGGVVDAGLEEKGGE